MRVVDLRSDTVTIPPRDMLETILSAKLGDDVYGEDQTVNEFQALAAERMGKEAALLVTSGTMANTVSLLAQTSRGDEVILESKCHIYHHELGNFSTLGGLVPRLVAGKYGVPNPRDIEALIEPATTTRGRTMLICLENTHNRAGGTIIPPGQMAAIHALAKKYGICVHLDGARIFNAAVACNLDVKDFTQHVDTMMFCISKGLGAPIGSVVLGDEEFIARARQVRRSLGGGMRKAGIIAAPGIYALNYMVDRLKEDHENAHLLAEGIGEIPNLALDMATVQTNMVMCNIAGLGMTNREFIAEFSERGVKVSEAGPNIRMVTHYGITREDIEYAIGAMHQVARQ